MKVTIQNFRCFRTEVSFDFKNGAHTLISGDSGKGKSTIFEGISWCLYGNMRNIYPNGTVPSSTNKTCVCIELDNLKITRSYSPEQVKIDILTDGITKTLTQGPAQEYINSKFGSKNIFMSLAYIKQGEKCPLMTASNAERMNLLNEILYGNDNSSTFENPEFYLDKLDEELEKIINENASQTAIFNSCYNKYMSSYNQFENKYNWPEMTQEKLLDYQDQINKIKVLIPTTMSDIIKISNLENKLTLIKSKLDSFNLSSFNCNFDSNLESTLNLKIEEYNMLHQKLNLSISNRSKYLTINTEIERHKNLIKDVNIDIYENIDNNIKQLTFEINTLKNEILSLTNEYTNVNKSETQIKMMNDQLTNLNNELKKYQEALTQYENIDIITLNKILTNSLIYQKMTELYTKITNLNVNSESLKISELDISNLKSKYNNLKINVGYVDNICQKFNLKFEDVPLKLQNIKEIVEFDKIQKQHLLNHKIYNETLSQLNNLIEKISSITYNDYLDILNFEDINEENIKNKINLITSRLGNPLKCPSCNCELEYNNNILTKPVSEVISKEIGSQLIQRLQRLLTIINDKNILTKQMEMLKQKLELIPLFDTDIVNKPIISNIELINYNNLIIELSKIIDYKFESDETLDLINQKLLELDTLESYYNLSKEYNHVSTNYDKNITVTSDVERIRKEIAIIPILLDNIKNTNIKIQLLEDNKNKIIISRSSEEVNTLLVERNNKLITIESEMSKLTSVQKTLVTINNYKQQILCIEFHTEEDIALLETQKNDLQNIIQTMKTNLNVYKDYMLTKNQYDEITKELGNKNSDQFKTELEELNSDLEIYNDMYIIGNKMYTLMIDRQNLENIQIIVTELTSKQSNINLLKNIISEVSTATMQNLVDSINEITNQVLDEIFEASIVVELKLYKEIKSKHKVKQNVNFGIYYNGNEYSSVDALSGGEKSRISLALAIALNSICGDIRFVMLDEILGALPEALRENCIDVIKKFLVENSNRYILEVEHNSTEGMFDDCILVK